MELDISNVDRTTKTALKCKLGILSRPDGSALFCEGESAVMAAIYAPAEAKMHKVLIDKASVECYYRPKTGLPGVQDRFREAVIKNICHTSIAASLYPRTAVYVNIQEMQNRGQLISSAINAACLACLDAGIDMKFIFGAISCFMTKSEEFCLVPPINEDHVKCLFVLVFNNTTGSIIATHTEGCFTTEQYQQAVSICQEESKNLFRFIKKQLEDIL